MKITLILIIYISVILNAPTIKKATIKQKPINVAILIYLRKQCEKKSLNYLLLKAQMKAESNGKFYCTEWQKGKPISFGLFQICYATLRMYLEAKKITVPPIRVSQARRYWKVIKYFPYWKRKYIVYLFNLYHNIDVHCWNMCRLLKRYNGCYYKSFSAHNMGMTCFDNYRKRKGKMFFYPYINLIRKRGGKL